MGYKMTHIRASVPIVHMPTVKITVGHNTSRIVSKLYAYSLLKQAESLSNAWTN